MKQRLIGAIVLVSLAVIFIPIILEGPDDEWTPRNHSIPEQPQMDYRAEMELDLPPETPEADAVIVEEIISEEPTEPVPAAAVATTAEVPASIPEPARTAPEPVPPVKQAAPAAPEKLLLKGWFVQVGSFGQEMNASGLRDRLSAAGFKVQLQTVEIGKKHAYRVLVGPSGTRAEAEKQAAGLKSGQQLKGMVIEYPG